MKPLQQLWDRATVDKGDSDASYFLSLMYLGEFLTKITAVGLLAAVQEDKSRSRYKHLYQLARSSGIGDWAKAIDETLTGPAAQFLLPTAYIEQRELLQPVRQGSWQHSAVDQLQQTLSEIGHSPGAMPVKVQGKLWFHWFATLRNKTRGHGAQSHVKLGALCESLSTSLALFCENFSLFDRPWAHLHRNLSGKYRVTEIGQPSDAFDALRKSSEHQHDNGIYISYEDVICPVALVTTNASVSDFFLANGGFDGARYELISYATGESQTESASDYLTAPGELPQSETHALRSFDVVGEVLANVPPPPRDYVSRPDMQNSLAELLLDDRHPIVTLLGRGGIGKTALTLATIPAVAQADRFDIIVWFSARDIDLLPEGPKPVRPDVLTADDVAKQYAQLMDYSANSAECDAKQYMNQALGRDSEHTSLFVFDNFETINDLSGTYSWLDQHIRNPNKILITTRMRNFRGDYSIEVGGMTEQQSHELIEKTARRLGILAQITGDYRRSIYEESGGHPYIIKMLLGAVSPGRPARNVKRILASQEDILPALFERTFKSLSPAAQRLFLTIANWNSTIPVVALQCVLLRDANERMDIDAALKELENSSLIEIAESGKDGQLFVHMPIAAQTFGKSRLIVSSYRAAVLADTELLHNFGAGAITDVKRGLAPRVARFIRAISNEVAQGKRALADIEGLLQFLARRERSAWFDIADLYEEVQPRNWREKSKDAIRQYLASTSQDPPATTQNTVRAWKKLAELCRDSQDSTGELNALIGLVRVPGAPLYEISNAANQFNGMLSRTSGQIAKDEKLILTQELVSIMAQHYNSASATDLSRLAWLCLHLGRTADAKKYVKAGLEKQPDNVFCQRLAERLARH